MIIIVKFKKPSLQSCKYRKRDRAKLDIFCTPFESIPKFLYLFWLIKKYHSSFDQNHLIKVSISGCLTSDLASVLVLCTEADVRRHYADEILKEYYDTLVKEHGAIQFSFEQVGFGT